MTGKFLPLFFFTALFSLIRLSPLHAQDERLYENWRWAYFSTTSGLPANNIDDLVETENGTVWVSTVGGIAWFDGFRWRKITTSQGLPEKRATRINEGPHNTILVTLEDTLYQGGRDGFRKIETPGFYIGTFCMFDSTTILMSTDSEPYPLQKYADGRFEPFRGITHLGGLHRTRSGKVWCLAFGGFYEISKEISKMSASQLIVNKIFEDNDGNYVFACESPKDSVGVWEWYKGKTMEFSKTERLQMVRSLDVSSTGDVIVAYESGEIHLRHNRRWKNLQPVPSQMYGLKNFKYGRDGNLWVGTERGLYLFRSNAKQWIHRKYGFSDPRNMVMEIFRVTSGDIWIGTMNGLEILHPNGSTSHIVSVLGKPLGLITGINQDVEGNIWISSGSSFAGAYRWNGLRWKYFGYKDGLRTQFVHKIEKDNMGRLWFLGLGQWNKYTIANDKEPGAFLLVGDTFQRWSTQQGLVSNRVYSFVETRNGGLWWGTKMGISRYQDGLWKSWTSKNLKHSSAIYTMATDNQDRVWFSSSDSRLGYIGTDDSLHWVWDWRSTNANQDRVWDISFDSKGTLWIAARNGLFSSRDGVWSSYNLEEGSQLKELRVVLPLEDKIFVGGHGTGVWILDRNEIGFPIRIEISDPIIEPEQVRLRWTVDAFWGAMRSEDIEVRYRVNGRQWSEWSEWSKGRETVITGLEDGQHHFEVQAKDQFGNIREDMGRASVDIPPPFFKRPVYFIPLTLLMISVVYLVIRMILVKIQYKKILQEQRIRIAHDLHDEVGSNLGSIALISQRIGRNARIPASIRKELSVVAQTAIRTADDLRDIVWYINPKNDTIMNLETRLRETARIMLSNVQCNFQARDTVGTDQGLTEIRRNILFMFKEILHNIVKHSQATKVWIEFDRAPRRFTLTVRDNGKGFSLHERMHGNGLNSLKKRASEIGADLGIKADQGKGTTIEIVIQNHVNT